MARVKFISYDGAYPNLCSGVLVLEVDGKRVEFPSHAFRTGGCVYLKGNGQEVIEDGPWSINHWPEGFPEELENETEEVVNDYVTWGCCGGCV